MSALRPHIVAARAYSTAFSEQASSILRQMMGGRGNDAVVMLAKQAELLAAAHARAAEIMQAEQDAEYASAEVSPVTALQKQLRVAERDLDRARSAHDSSTFHGRSRTEDAEREVQRLRAAIGGDA